MLFDILTFKSFYFHECSFLLRTSQFEKYPQLITKQKVVLSYALADTQPCILEIVIRLSFPRSGECGVFPQK
jgi:hypothetical protein